MKNHLIAKAIVILFKFGAKKTAINYIENITNKRTSLKKIRAAISISKQIKSPSLVDKYASKAIILFPKNSYGYIEKAKSLIESGHSDEARELMLKAPKSTETRSILTPSEILSSRKKHIKSKEKLNPLENALIVANADEALLLAIEKEAINEIRTYPDKSTGYKVLCKVYEQKKDYQKVISTIESMPSEMKCNLENQIKLSMAFICKSDYKNAYTALMKAQVNFPSNRRILLLISDILKKDAQPVRAYSFIKAAKFSYPEYVAVRQLAFEIDNNLIDEAKCSFKNTLNFTPIEFMKFSPIINRAIPFIDDLKCEIINAKQAAYKILNSDTGRKGINPSKQVSVAIKNRWLSLAERIIIRNCNGKEPVSSQHCAWLNDVISRISEHEHIFELANENEKNIETFGFYKKNRINLSTNKNDNKKIVEIFLPSVFFSNPQEEKASYNTIRTFYSIIFTYLLAREDTIIVPRHQWNWRKCDPKVNGAYIISYHTYSEFNPLHLHIQESTLAGRCTVDFKGFAGYSSISKTFHDITNKAAPLSLMKGQTEALTYNYIKNNISKYEQNSVQKEYIGDYVFIALQIPTDIVASLSYINGVDLVSAVAHHYHKTSTKVIVKRHPYCNSKSIQSLLSTLEKDGLIELSSASIHDLIANAKAVFTVNSGVGLEALMHKKPVIVCGECDYAYAVSAQVRDKEELLKVLNGKIIFNENRTYEFLHYYLNYYSIKCDDRTKTNKFLDGWLDTKITIESSHEQKNT